MDKARTSTKSLVSDEGKDSWDHCYSSPNNHTKEAIIDDEHGQAIQGKEKSREEPIVMTPIDEGKPLIDHGVLNNNDQKRNEDAIHEFSPFVGGLREEEEDHHLYDVNDFGNNNNRIVPERGSFVPQIISLCRNDPTPHSTYDVASQCINGSDTTSFFPCLPITMIDCEDDHCASLNVFSSPLEIIDYVLQLLDEAEYIIDDDDNHNTRTSASSSSDLRQ